MNNWNLFLNNLQADELALEPATDSTSTPTYLVDLRHQGLLSIEGPDAAKFLQGQVTCDVRELAEKVTRLGAQCTLKGRMLLSFRALQLESEQILLRMHAGLAEKALSSFGKYIVFSKAKLHDRSDNYRHIGLYGPAAETLLIQVLGAAPTERDEWCQSESAVVIKLEEQRYECWLLPDQAERIWLALMPTCALAGENLWTLLDIRAGMGEVRPETSEFFTPQALNYQLVNGINFRKGCYTGQEIVARLHYRGTLKRHMYRFVTRSDSKTQLPLPGSAVLTAEQRNIGEIVLSAQTNSGAIEILATIADEYLMQAYCAPEALQKLEQLPLPYAIPSEVNS
jgi:hypothetical protein